MFSNALACHFDLSMDDLQQLGVTVTSIKALDAIHNVQGTQVIVNVPGSND
jgi:hypothetical protein